MNGNVGCPLALVPWAWSFCVVVAVLVTLAGCPPPVPEPAPTPETCEFAPSARAEREAAERIVGGSPAKSPVSWMTSLQSPRGAHYCGGTLIAPRVVLTAAHCQALPGDVAVIGSLDLREPGIVRAIAEARNHPDWSHVVSGHDVAVLLLDEPVDVEPIALSTERPNAGDAVALGWGRTCESCPTSPVLVRAELPIVTREACSLLYPSLIQPDMLCAGTAEKDACYGDSGGPLLLDGAQVGITSWGRGCARVGSPGVFTAVAQVRDWIEVCSR